MGIFNKLAPITNGVSKYAVEHKSGLCFVAGIISQVSAIALTVDATIKANNAITESELAMDADYLIDRTKWETFKDRFKVSWKYYIPVAVAEISSITCHAVSKKEDQNKIALLSSA